MPRKLKPTCILSRCTLLTSSVITKKNTRISALHLRDMIETKIVSLGAHVSCNTPLKLSNEKSSMGQYTGSRDGNDYLMTRKKTPPPSDSTRAHISTPGDIYFVFYHHFTTGGTLDNTPPYACTLENSVKLHNYHTTWWMDTIHNSRSTRTRMNTSMEATAAPPPSHQWAERACGCDPTCSCCCRASGDDHVVFLWNQRAYRYWQ